MTALPAREAIAKARVLVVGDAMLDRYWFGAVERISPEAPVPIVRVNPGKHQERLGGAANVAWNVQALGARASLLTAIGDDEHGHRLEALLAKSGIETLFKRDPRLTTIVKLRVIGRSQQLLRIDFEEEPDHEVLDEMRPLYEDALTTSRTVLFSDYGKGGLTHIPTMIRAARAAGLPVLVDPKGSDYRRYQGATVVTPNRNELAQVIGPWTSEAQLHERAQALRLWNTLMTVRPAAFNLVVKRYAASARAAGESASALDRLQSLYDKTPTVDLLETIASLQPDDGARREKLLAHLREHPTLAAAQALLASQGAARRPGGAAVADGEPSGLAAGEAGALRDAVKRAARPLHRYRCAACGFEAEHYFWQCPGCLGWDTYPPQRLEDL
jgi:rfaE bifunctional protein kinase chain/domain